MIVQFRMFIIEYDCNANMIKIRSHFGNNIELLPHARLVAWPRRTRRPAKCHVAEILPEVHGNYYN